MAEEKTNPIEQQSNEYWNKQTPEQGIEQYDKELDSSFKSPPTSDGIHFQGTDVPMPVWMRPEDESPMQSALTDASYADPVNPVEIDENMGFIEMAGKSFIVGIGDMVDSFGDIADFMGGSASSDVSKQVYGTDTSKPISDSLHNFADYLHSFGDDVPGLNDLEDVTWDDLADADFWATGVARMIPFALSLMVPATYAAKGISAVTKGAKFLKSSKAIAKGASSLGIKKYSSALAARGLIQTGIATTGAGATANLIEGAALAGQTLNEGVKQGLTEREAMNAAHLVYTDNLASMAADIVQYGLFMGQMGIGKGALNSAKKLGAKFAGTSTAKTVAGVAGKAAVKTGASALKAPGIKNVIKNSFKAIGMGAAQGVTDGVVEQFQEVYQDWSVQRRIAEQKGQDFPDYLDFFLADEQRPTRVLSFATSLIMSGTSNTIRTATENRSLMQKSIDNRNETHEYVSAFTKDLGDGKFTVKRQVTVNKKNEQGVVIGTEQKEVIEELSADEAVEFMRDSAAYNMAMNAVKEGDQEVVLDFFEQQYQQGNITEEQHTTFKDTLKEVETAMEGKPTHDLDNMGKSKLVANSWLLQTSKKRLAQQREGIEAKIASIEQSIKDGDIKEKSGKKQIEGLKKLAESSLAAQEELIKGAKENIDEVYRDSDKRKETKDFISDKAPKLKEIVAKEKRGEELTDEEKALIDDSELSKEFYKAEKAEQDTKEAYEKVESEMGDDMEGYTLDKSETKDGTYVFVKENKKDGSVSTVTLNPDGSIEKTSGRIDEVVDEVEKDLLEKEKLEKEKQEEKQKEEAKEEAEEDKTEDKTEDKKEEEDKKDKPKIKIPSYLNGKNIKDSALLVRDIALKFAKAFFNKEKAVKIVDAIEAAAMRRKVRRAIKMGGGSDRTLANLYAKKAVDGIISIQFLDEIYSHGETAAAYAMGMGVFINPSASTDSPEEALFHENFHIFRMLYGKTKEVMKMMRAVVHQPVYKKMKLDYQENILYAVPDGAGKMRTLTQLEALTLLKRIQESNGQGSLFPVITKYADYIRENGLANNDETKKAFYEASLILFDEAGFVELKGSKQVHIQDEALAKLGGLYGSVNQDIFIQGQAKKDFNDGMKSFKEMIRGSITEEEAQSAFQVISKDLYDPSKTRKGTESLESLFAKINDVVRKNEANYGEYASTQAAQTKKYNKRKAITKEAINIINGSESQAKLYAEEFAKTSFDALMKKAKLDNEEDLKKFIEDSINLQASVQKTYKQVASTLLGKYAQETYVGSPDYNIAKTILLSEHKKIKKHILNAHKQALKNKIAQKTEQVLINLDSAEINDLSERFKNLEQFVKVEGPVEYTEELTADDTFSDLIGADPKGISEQFSTVIDFYVRRENNVQGGSGVTKDNLLTILRNFKDETRSSDEFVEKSWGKIEEYLKGSTAKLTRQDAILGSFFTYLTSELDIIPYTTPYSRMGSTKLYGTALQGAYLQLDSMVTEKSMFITTDGFGYTTSREAARNIQSALDDTLMLDIDTIKPGTTRLKQNLEFLSGFQFSKNELSRDDKAAMYTYQKRMKYSQSAAELLYSDNIGDRQLLEFINTYFLPMNQNNSQGNGYAFTYENLDDFMVYDVDTDSNVSLRNYFSNNRIEQLLFDSITIQFPQGEDMSWKTIAGKTAKESGQAYKDEAMTRVFRAVFKNSPAIKGGKKISISPENLAIAEEKFLNNFRFAYQNTERFSVAKHGKPNYVKKLNTQSRIFSPEADEIYNGLVAKDDVVARIKSAKIDTNSETSLRNTLNFLGLDSSMTLPEVLEYFEIEAIGEEGLWLQYSEKTWNKPIRASINIRANQKGFIDLSLNNLQGHKKSAKAIIATYQSENNNLYMSNIKTPEGNTLNKNTRKYFLEYNKDLLNDMVVNNFDDFSNMFTEGDIVNPYAAGMMDNSYKLEYTSLDGSIATDKDRDNIQADEITRSDIKAISKAIKEGNTSYMQVIRDFSDKSRRYYAKAFISVAKRTSYGNYFNNVVKKKNGLDYNRYIEIDSNLYAGVYNNKQIESARAEQKKLEKKFIKGWIKSTTKDLQKKLAEVRAYHNAKTKQVIDNHNSDSDFDLFKVASQKTIDFLSKTYDIKGYGKSVSTVKGELNLLGDLAFQQTIDGKIYDVLDTNTHVEMMEALELDYSQAIASLHYTLNKYWLQDLNSFVGEESNYSEKNKRSTLFIAPHDKLFGGRRVEPLVFNDEKISFEDQKQKVKVIDYETGKLKEIELSPKTADSASFVTIDEAQRMMASYGGMSGVQGSFKLVGAGRNYDNKRMASHIGLSANQFYFKGHTIVLDNKVKGVLKGIYTKMKSREAYYKSKGLDNHSVIAYNSEAVKKGLVKGVNSFSLANLNDKQFDINVEMDKYSFDVSTGLRGYDGRFFGVQNELDKEAVTATAAKQKIGSINVFYDHQDASVRAATKKVHVAYGKALDLQYKDNLEGYSFEGLAKQDLNSSSMPPAIRAMFSQGYMSLPAMKDAAYQIASSKIKKNQKLRTKGTLSIQETDLIEGHEIKDGKLIETDDTLKPTSVEEVNGKMVVEHAEAIVSGHMARKLGVKEGDLFLATRIPASSAGSTMVMKVKKISKKSGNTIAISSKSSEIIGADLDGDMLHINVLDKSKKLSEIAQAKNDFIQSIIDLYSMPETINMLTKIIEFDKNIAEPSNMALYGNKEGSTDINNDLSILGANNTFATSKGNVPMIGNIAAQNLTFSYIAQNNPRLFFEFSEDQKNPITIKTKSNRKGFTNLSNTINKDGSGTFYELCNYLNLILDDGKYGNRAKFQFVKSTASQFITLIKYGMKPAEISLFLKEVNFASFDNMETSDIKDLTQRAAEDMFREIYPGSKYTPSVNEIIQAIFVKNGSLEFDLAAMTKKKSSFDKKEGYNREALLFNHVMKQVSQDILNLSLFVSLDKRFNVDTISGLFEHQEAIEALNRQEDIKNTQSNNPVFSNFKDKNSKLIKQSLDESTQLNNGYSKGLLGDFTIDEVITTDNDGILNSERELQPKQDETDPDFYTPINIYSNFDDVASDADKNKNIVKALNFGRMLIHSSYDVETELNKLHEEMLGEDSPLSDWATSSVELKMFNLFDMAYTKISDDVQANKYKGNKWLDRENGILKIRPRTSFVTNSKGVISQVNNYDVSIDVEKVSKQLEFVEQVDLYKKDFAKLSPKMRTLLVLTDFLNTGWGSKNSGTSMIPYMDNNTISKIDNYYKKVQNNEDVSTFDGDMEILKDRLSDKVNFTGIPAVDNRRIAAILNLMVNGVDAQSRTIKETGEVVAYNSYNGLYPTYSQSLNQGGFANESSFTKDLHHKTEISSRTGIELTSKKDGYVYKKSEYKFKQNTSWPQLAITTLSKEIANDKNSVESFITYEDRNALIDEVQNDLKNQQNKKYLKIPTHGNQNYGAVGEKMSKRNYYKTILDQLVREGKSNVRKISDLNEDEIDQLEKQYKVYEKSVEFIKGLYTQDKDLFNNSTYKLNYKDKANSFAALKLKMNAVSEAYKELRDEIKSKRIALGKENYNVDPIAAASLIQYMQYKFSEHITEYQIADWENKHGKSFVEEITKPNSELRKKDIGLLDLIWSPGDFGKSKPAIAYINKELKGTHMTFTRNISLMTEEMNSKLDALYKEKFGDGLRSKGIALMKKYIPFGTLSYDEILFGNFFSFNDRDRKGIKKTIDRNGEVTYRDVSNLELKSIFFFSRGKFANSHELKSDEFLTKSKDKGGAGLSKAELDYLKMYVKYTNFYRNMIEAKNLYEANKGAAYIPNINSSTWETLHRRGLYGMYFQMSKGDEDFQDIKITAINPITNEEETLDYFSWKAIYMHAPGEKFTVYRPQKTKRGVTMVSREETSLQQMTALERRKGFNEIKNKAKSIWEARKDDNGDFVKVPSALNQLMNLESETAINRSLHRRSMSSAYLATFNLHKALSNYNRLMMFQHGNQYKDKNGVYHHLSWAGDDGFEVVNPISPDTFPLAFSGFNEKLGEVDAAISSLEIKDNNPNAFKYLEKVVKGGLIKKEKNLTWTDSPYKILNQQPEKVVVNFFTQWTMYVALGLNFSAAAGNVLIGKFNAYRQAGGKALLKGEARFWGLNKDTAYNPSDREKARKMISTFGILTYRAEEVAEGIGGSSLSSLFFGPMVLAENWIQQASFLGNLEQEQWDSYFVNKDGELEHKSDRKGITETERLEWVEKSADFKKRTGKNLKLTKEDVASLERKVIDVQGRGYSETDIRYIQLYSLGNMVMQFKRWLPTFFADRLRREDVNDLGDMTIGSMVASRDFLVKMWTEGKMSNPKEFRKAYNALPKHRQEAVTRFYNGTTATTLAALLYALVLHGTDDDEWDDTEKMMEKFLGDTMLMINVPKLIYMTNIPATDTMENLALAISHGIAGTEYQRKAKYGDKGDPKAMAHFARLMPASLRSVLETGSAGKSNRKLN